MSPTGACLFLAIVLLGLSRIRAQEQFEALTLVCPSQPLILRIRDDYVYTPGIGAHKLHSTKLAWNIARKICIAEGAHLAVLNSVAEARKLAKMLEEGTEKEGTNEYYAWIGFHDFFAKRDWVTVHGDPLAGTGYTQWKFNEPNGGEEHCGSMDKFGGLNDHLCESTIPFVCEMPSSVLPVNCNS